MTLPELIAAIEAGPVTRELNDEVLLAIGWGAVPNDDWWYDPKGARRICPSPLEDLQDATLAVPEGWDWQVNSYGHARVNLPDDPEFNFREAECDDEPARALVLATLKAEQAKREAEG